MIVCSRCGFENEDSDSFCGSCASFLEWDGKRVETDPEPEPTPAAEPEPPAEVRQGIIGRVKEVIGFTDVAAGGAAGEAGGPGPSGVDDPALETSTESDSDSVSTANLGPVSAPLSPAGYRGVGQAPPPPPLFTGNATIAGGGPEPAGTDIEASSAGGSEHDVTVSNLPAAGGLSVPPTADQGLLGETQDARVPAEQVGLAGADANATTSAPAPVVPGVPGPSLPGAVRPGSVRPSPGAALPSEPSRSQFAESKTDAALPGLVAPPIDGSPDVVASPPASSPTEAGPVQSGRQPAGAVQPGAVQPGAVKPGAAPARRPAPKKPLATPDIKPGDKICGQCGFGNDPTRQFCRHCGASLVEAAVYTMSWYRRLWRRLTMRRQHAAGERPRTRRRAIGGSGPGWLTSWVTRLVTLGVAALVLLSFVGPWHKSLHARETRYYHDIANTIHPTYNPLHPVSATASSSAAGHPASNLIDGAINTSWQSAAVATPQTISLQLPAPSDIAKIGFLNGDQDLPQDFVTEPRVQQLQVVFNGPAPMSKTITLSDTPNFQTFSVSTKSTSSITISILSVYPATGGGKNLSIAEIELFTKS